MSNSNHPTRMTKSDLYDWIRSHNCIQKQLPSYKANVIMFENPKSGREAWLDLPIDDSEVRDFTIVRICGNLGIPYPSYLSYMKTLDDKIQDDFFNKKRR